MQMRNENVYAVGAVVQPGESKDLISPLCKGCKEPRSCTKPVLKCLTLSSTKLQPQSLHPLSTTHMLDFKPLLQSKQHIQNRTQAI